VETTHTAIDEQKLYRIWPELYSTTYTLGSCQQHTDWWPTHVHTNAHNIYWHTTHWYYMNDNRQTKILVTVESDDRNISD